MKNIGLIGGMSWESSLEYYRTINEAVKARLGGFHSARCVMVSVDFAEIEKLQRQGNWAESARILVEAARSLENAGADLVLLCTNTMHKVADDIQAGITVPFLHIADAAAKQIKSAGLSRIGLLGTRFTMEEDFYKDRLTRQHGLDVIVPDKAERQLVDRVIFEELVLGQIRPESRQQYLQIIQRLVQAGAQGIVLGCTEIGLLVRQEDASVPLFDTAGIHALAAVELALTD